MIRVANRSDLKCISSMWSLLDDEVFEVASYIRKESDYGHIINDFILDIIDSSSSIIFLAEINGNIIGFSSGHVDKAP